MTWLIIIVIDISLLFLLLSACLPQLSPPSLFVVTGTYWKPFFCEYTCTHPLLFSSHSSLRYSPCSTGIWAVSRHHCMHHLFLWPFPLDKYKCRNRTIPSRGFSSRGFTFWKPRKPTKMAGEPLVYLPQMFMAISGPLKRPAVHTGFIHSKLTDSKCLFIGNGWGFSASATKTELWVWQFTWKGEEKASLLSLRPKTPWPYAKC